MRMDVIYGHAEAKVMVTRGHYCESAESTTEKVWLN